MPGPFERHRLLALELEPGSLKGARGLLRAPSKQMPQSDLAASAA
jgi:predicted N-acetyltransferase YhbS